VRAAHSWAVAIKSELHSLLHALQFNADQLQAYSGLMKRHSGYKQLVDPQLKAFETYEVLTVIQSE